MSNSPLSTLTSGLLPSNPNVGQASSLPVSGLGAVQPGAAPPPSPAAAQISNAQVNAITQAAALGPTTFGIPVSIYDSNGCLVSPGIDITNTGGDLISNPALPTGLATYGGDLNVQDIVASYTGSDLRIIVDVVDAMRPWPTGTRLSKQLIECTTLTVSVHREKDAVRACSFINPKGFARGKRTIAGTIILTQGVIDVLYRFLTATLWNDTSKDSGYIKTDQLPPMDFTMVFANELGQSSYRRLLGVDFLTDGTIYSMNDAFTEQTISYVAADFTPLLPFTLACLSPLAQRQSAMAQTTPGDIMKNNASQNSPNTALNQTIVKQPTTISSV
jgi:hypothetical protein